MIKKILLILLVLSLSGCARTSRVRKLNEEVDRLQGTLSQKDEEINTLQVSLQEKEEQIKQLKTKLESLGVFN